MDGNNSNSIHLTDGTSGVEEEINENVSKSQNLTVRSTLPEARRNS